MKKLIVLYFLLMACAIPAMAANLPVSLVNSSEYPNSDLYWCILGFSSEGSTAGKMCYVNINTGTPVAVSEADNTVMKNGQGYSNYFYKVSDKPSFLLPPMYGARLFISVGGQMYFKIIGNGYAGADFQNPADANAGIKHEIIEFTQDGYGYHGNTTRVDHFSYPISMRLKGEGDYDKIVGEYISYNEVISKFQAYVNGTPFTACYNATSGMITAPGKTNGFPSNYFDDYMTSIWTKYKTQDLTFKSEAGTFTGRVQADGRFIFHRESDNMPAVISRKPTTKEVLEGSGVLAEHIGVNGTASPEDEKTLSMVVQAIFCASANRHVIEESSWSKSANYYKTEPYNLYSGFFHSEGISYGQLSYGFCYDDVYGQSTLLENDNSTELIIYFGGGGVEDPTGGNTNGGLAKPNVGGEFACSGSATTFKNDIDFNYSFVPSGNSVTVTFQATTPKEGYVAVLQDKTEGMIENTFGNGTTVSQTITAEPGENVIVTGKWMFAGGDAFTKDFVYKIGSGCGDPGDDTQAPTSPSNLQVSSVTQTDVNLTWTSSTDNVGVVGYKIYNGITYIKTVATNSANITGLTAETAYTFNVSAIDAAGNESAKASVSTTTLKEGQVGDSSCAGTSTDAVDGTFSNGYKYEFTTTGTTVTVNFEMLDVKEGLVAYAFTYNPNFAEYPMTQGSGQKFSKTFTGQTAGSTFKVACKFAFAGGLAVTKTFEYTVGDLCGGDTPGDDTEAPTSPSNLQVSSVSQTDVNLTWTSSTDNVGVVGYKIYNGITYIKTVATNTANITGLTASTGYTFNVSAIDAAGNESAKASVATTTLNEGEIGNSTCAGTSTDAVEGEFSLGYNYQFSTSGTDVTVTFELLDSKVGLVAYAFTYNPNFAETPMTQGSGQTFSKTFTGQTDGATFNIACKFAFAGGLAITKTFSYTVGDNCISTDIQNKKTNSSIIYPNPAKEYVFIDTQAQGHLTISDISGRILLSNKTIEAGTNSINIGNYSTGIYILNIDAETFLLRKE